MRFKGQVAVITGGARGIGLGVAQRMASEGASLALLDIDKAAATSAAESFGDHAIGLAVDVRDETSVNEAMLATQARFGRLDILINSAGVTGPNTLLESYSADAWRQVIDINLNGAFLCCKAAIPAMRANNYGRIVNIASIAGKEGNPNASAYSASKAGLIGLTKSLGKELAATEIRVNAVTPAAVKTDIFNQMTEAHINFMLSKIPLNRFGLVEEVANLVCWLSSRECSFSTGAVFDVSGGRATY